MTNWTQNWLMQRALMWLNLYGFEAVRHKLKNRQKCFFGVFRLFLPLSPTASWPYRLSYINALCINQSYKPKDQSMKFSQKNWELVILKNSFFFLFWVGHLGFFFSSSPWKFWWLPGFPAKNHSTKTFQPPVYTSLIFLFRSAFVWGFSNVLF